MNSPLHTIRDQSGVNPSRSNRHKSPAHFGSGSCATYSVLNILELQLVPGKISRLGWMMRNPMYLVSLDDGDEEEIDSLDLAPLESSSAPNVIVPADAEEDAVPRKGEQSLRYIKRSEKSVQPEP